MIPDDHRLAIDRAYAARESDVPVFPLPRILAAFSALARAIPGAPHAHVSLHGCTGVTLGMLVQGGGRSERYECDAQNEEWDCVTFTVDGASISAYGKHRFDPATVDAAIAQAVEAVS